MYKHSVKFITLFHQVNSCVYIAVIQRYSYTFRSGAEMILRLCRINGSEHSQEISMPSCKNARKMFEIFSCIFAAESD